MNFQIKGVENQNNNTFIFTGYSNSLQVHFKVRLSKVPINQINLRQVVNEGNFNVIIPNHDFAWNINTTLDGVPFNIHNNINEGMLKTNIFPYSYFGIPNTVWQCLIGSITTEL